MKTIASLILKDLKRDARRPWSMILFASLPLVMTALMAVIFGGGGANAMPTIRVAVLDQDKDFFSRLLKSLPMQGDQANKLQVQIVDDREEGIRLIERRKASALVVLPHGLTDNLLAGETNTIELYQNPAEQVLPRIVRQGLLLLTAGLSGAAELLGEPLRNAREMFRANEFPTDPAVAGVTLDSVQKMRNYRTYLFPPLIQFRNVNAVDYQVFPTNSTSPTLSSQ